jgi:queuine tRNA-ribosyltransferase
MLFDECPPYPCDEAYAAKSLALTTRWAGAARIGWSANEPRSGERPPTPFRHRPGLGLCRSARTIGPRTGGTRLRRLRDRRRLGRRTGARNVPRHRKRGAVPAARQAALRDGARHAAADSGNDRPRRGHVRLRDAHPRRPPRRGLHPRRPAAHQEPDPRQGPRPLCESAHPHVAGFSRAYLRHLFRAGEILALRLLSFHNLHFYLRLVAGAREAIAIGNFPEYKDSFIRRYTRSENHDTDSTHSSPSPDPRPKPPAACSAAPSS